MNYLLQISVGPVQDFISSARRTRDLWFGSNMLSEISKAVAKSVQDNGGKLIFPAPEKDDDLSPGSDLSVANVILAEFENDDGEKLKYAYRAITTACEMRITIIGSASATSLFMFSDINAIDKKRFKEVLLITSSSFIRSSLSLMRRCAIRMSPSRLLATPSSYGVRTHYIFTGA